MDKIDGLSLDLEKNNIERLKELFPAAVEEGKINFDMLRTLLGDEVDDSREKYQFTWNGKAKAIKLAQTPSSATLRPCKEKSKDWDTTENLYIEGDNLEVLKQLQKTYYGKIKMIYIDPPYNTGNDFVYHDDFKNSIENYKEQTNQLASSNPESNGRFHTDWLNMMYPRLLLAKNLLSDDGFLAISIGEEEIHNLANICNEIFGENNFRNTITVRRYDKNLNLQFVDQGLKSMNVGYEYILIYSKTNNSRMCAVYKENNDQRSNVGYWKGFWNNADRPTMRYELLGYCPKDGQWKWKKEVALEAVENYKKYLNEYSNKMSLEDYWKKTGSNKRFIRRNINGSGKNMGVEHWVAPSNVILRNTNWLDMLISKPAGSSIHFESPKNPDVLKILMDLFSIKDNDFVLDFFSGSATTAHALMKLNAEDGGNCKFIMVQLPEKCDEKSEAYKAGYDNICNIGEERIRRAGERIKAEWEKEHPSDTLFSNDEEFTTDIGFKVFKLDSSNVNEWDSSLELDEKELAERLGEVFKTDRSKEDILYEIMLKYGVFDRQVEDINVNGKTMYRVGKRYMIVCLEDNIDSSDIKAIGELSPKTVIFKESGFIDDNAKLNAIYNLEKAGVEDVKCI